MITVRILVFLLCVAHSSLAGEVSFDELLRQPAVADLILVRRVSLLISAKC